MPDDRALIASARAKIEFWRTNDIGRFDSLTMDEADALLRHYDALRLNESKRASFAQSFGGHP